ADVDVRETGFEVADLLRRECDFEIAEVAGGGQVEFWRGGLSRSSGPVDFRERLRGGEVSEAKGDERGRLVLVEQERGRAARVRVDGRRLLRAGGVCGV